MSRASRLAWLGLALGFELGFGACGGRAAFDSSRETRGSNGETCEDDAPAASAGAQGGAPPLSSGGTSSAGAAAAPVDASDSAGSGGQAASADAGAAGAAGEPATGGSCSRFATGVVDHAFGDGQNFNQEKGFPGALLGPPAAGDPSSVVSLGNGGWVILEFAGSAIVDGPGVDFTVFENPLANFQELGTVAVSDDLTSWIEFPCTAAQDAANFGYCGGVGVVLSSPRNGVDPLDPRVSGGDHYDLADIHVSHARYVRITDRVDLTGQAGVFDLDAVAIVNAECR